MRHLKYFKNRIYSIIFLSILVAGCGNNLKEEKEAYVNEMEPVYEDNEVFIEEAEKLDTSRIESMYVGTKETISEEEIDEYLSLLNDELIPLATKMDEKVNNIEVMNEELVELHDSYKESVELKEQFAKELREYIDIFARSVEINKQLSDYGEKVLENKKTRDALVQGNLSKEEKEEIDELIEVINQNSETLEQEATTLQKDLSIGEKEAHIKNVLMPLLDEQIANINQLAIKTNKGKQIRTLSLEMFYTFKSYYEERANLMRVYEDEGNYQLQSILPKFEASNKITAKYHKNLRKLETQN